MSPKTYLKANIIDFNLMNYREICQELGQRLKSQRLMKNIKQQDLANRAGVSVGTVKNLETKGQSSLESFVRIIMALDMLSELESLLILKIRSIEQMEKAEKLASPHIPRRAR